MTVSTAYATLIEQARDGNLRLALDRIDASDGSRWSVSAYRFAMLLGDTRAGDDRPARRRQ